MRHVAPAHETPAAFVAVARPEAPVILFSPGVLQDTARRFLEGFPGRVSYAVKANPDPVILQNLAAAGIDAFDVASPAEIATVRAVAPSAALHYHNPARTRPEIAAGIAAGVISYAVDCPLELSKLVAALTEPAEISVRFKLPVPGASYDFGEKFGATPEVAAQLLRAAARAGHRPSLTFHPGTQCPEPSAWTAYIAEAARIAEAAGTTLHRLNVGGGFPARRMLSDRPDTGAIFAAIRAAWAAAFGPDGPPMVCEPGRAMVAEAITLAVPVKAIRGNGDVILTDGLYGGLSEFRDMGASDRIEVLRPDGAPRGGFDGPRRVWGPTCDSLDRLPGEIDLPLDLAEGDVLLVHGMGAYASAVATRFNGYGEAEMATIGRLGAPD